MDFLGRRRSTNRDSCESNGTPRDQCGGVGHVPSMVGISDCSGITGIGDSRRRLGALEGGCFRSGEIVGVAPWSAPGTRAAGRGDRVECRGLRPGTLPYHRTYGFPYTAVEPTACLLAALTGLSVERFAEHRHRLSKGGSQRLHRFFLPAAIPYAAPPLGLRMRHAWPA